MTQTKKRSASAKALSILLTVLMAFGYVGMFSGAFVIRANADASGRILSSGWDDIVIGVPETVYMTPQNNYNTATTSVKYYVNNTVSSSGGVSLDREKSKTVGKFYIYSKYISSVTGVTVNGASLGSWGLTKSGNLTYDDSFTLTLSSGISSSQTKTLEWAITCTMTDGTSATFYAYTVAYAPYLSPVFAAGKCKNTRGDKSFGSGLSWVSGIHGISTAGGYYPYNKFLPLLGGPTQGDGETSPDAWFNGGQQCGLPTKGGWYTQKEYGYWIGDETLCVFERSGEAYINVDTSRYTNLNQIPNLDGGIYVTDNEGAGTVWGYWGKLNNWGDRILSGREWHTRSTTNPSEYDASVDIYGGDRWTNRGQNWAIRNCAMNSGIPSGWVAFRGAFGTDGSGDRCFCILDSYVNFIQVDKSSWRSAVQNAQKYGFQSGWFTNASDFNDWKSYLKSVSEAVGNPTTTSCSTTNLTNQTNTLRTEYSGANNGAQVNDLGVVKVLSNTGVFSNQYNVVNISGVNNPIETEAIRAGYALTLKNTSYTNYTYKGNLLLKNQKAVNATFTNANLNTGLGIISTAANVEYKHITQTQIANGEHRRTFYYLGNDKTVTVDPNGGSWNGSASTTNVTGSFSGTFSPIDPTRTGYTFNGWEISSGGGSLSGKTYTFGASNGTIRAKWTPVTYTITYTLNGGTVSPANPASYTIETATFTLKNPTKTGHTFTGWTGSNGTTAQTSVSIAKGSTGDKNYTANWRINTSTLNVNPNGGTWSGSADAQTFTQNYNTTKQIANPTREGYTFTGWTLSSGANGTFSSGTYTYGAADGTTDTLTAGWSKNSYPVRFFKEDGVTQIGATQNVPYQEDATPPADETKDPDATYHYTFNGWSGYTNITQAKDIVAAFTRDAHNWTENTDIKYLKSAVTCTDPAVYYKSCSVCGYKGTETFTSGEALGHNWGEWQTVTPATCVAAGSKKRTCSRCGEEETAEIAKLDHSYTGEVKDNGNGTHSFKCVNGCNEYGGTVACAYGEYSVKTPATCLAAGVKERTCSVCGHKDTAEIAKLDHSYTGEVKDNGNGTHSFKCVNGCNEYGGTVGCTYGAWSKKDDSEHQRTCSACGHVETAAHTWDTGSVTTAPGCTTPGVKTYTCTAAGCGATYTEPVTALQHDWDAPTYSWSEDGTVCTATRVCKRDAGHTETEEVRASRSVKKLATCTEKGVHTYTATFANPAFATQTTERTDIEIDPNNHLYTAATVKEEALKTAATCTEAAVYYYSCARCGAVEHDDEKTFTNGTALGHTFNGTAQHVSEGKHNYECSVCHNAYGVGSGAEAVVNGLEDCSGGTANCVDKAVCAVCNEPYGSVDPANHKSLRHVAAVPAKCEEDGNKEYWICDACEKIYADADCTQQKDQAWTVDPQTGHDWDYANAAYTWTGYTKCTAHLVCLNDDSHTKDVETTDISGAITTVATCTVEGIKTYTAHFTEQGLVNQTTTENLGLDPFNHNNMIQAVAYVPETCEETGIRAHYVCAACGNHYQDIQGQTLWTETDYVIPAKKHDWTGTPTYVWEDDNHQMTATLVCKNDPSHVCSETVRTTENISKQPTCTEEGVATYTAMFANTAINNPYYDFDGFLTAFTTQTTTAEVDMIPHTLTPHEAVAAKCHTKGNIAYWTCSVCGKIFSDSGAHYELPDLAATETDFDPNNHEDLQFVPAKTATCSEAGNNNYYYCSVCGKYYKDNLGYVETNLAAETIAVDPNNHVDAEGNDAWGKWIDKGVNVGHERTCTCCGAVETADHVWNEGVVTTQPDCENAGTRHQTCIVCGAERDIDEPALGHQLPLTHHEAVQPTCTEDGTLAYFECERCHEKFSDNAATQKMSTIVDPKLGHALVHHDAKAATCTEIGWAAYDTCSRCDYTTYEEIPATGHQNVVKNTDAKAATCVATGLIDSWKCTDCGTIFSDEAATTVITAADTVVAVDPNAHDWDEGTITTPANCVDEGVRTFTCHNNANHKKTESVAVDQNNHKGPTEIRDAVDATCTEAGYTGDTWCTACNVKIANGEEIEALGHDLVSTARVEATCTETGTEAYWTCSRCNKLFSDANGTTEIEEPVVIPEKGHDWGEWTVTTPATCIEKGEETRICKRDSSHKETQEIAIDPANHDLIHHDAKEPTCTEIGWAAYDTCSRCEYTTYAEIPATGHLHIEKYTDAKAPTCMKTGLIDSWKCADCGTIFADAAGTTQITEADTVIAIDLTNGHSWGDWTETTPATCTTDGVEVRVCAHNAQHKETRTIARLGHEMTYHAYKDSTCTEPGNYEYWHCSRCGANFSDGQGINVLNDIVIPAKGHDWTDWVVTVAGDCVTAHKEQRVCRRCSEVETKTNPPAGHKLSKVAKVEPTCIADGQDEYYSCSICHGNFEDPNAETAIADLNVWHILPALGHDFTGAVINNGDGTHSWKCSRCDEYGAVIEDVQTLLADGGKVAHDLQTREVKAATCTEMGDTEYTCSVCDYREVKTDIAALGHEMTFHPAVPNTCEEDGNVAYYACARCGKNFADEAGGTLLDTVVIEAKGHNYTGDYVCLEHGTHYRKCVNGCNTCGLGTEKDAAEACTYGEWTNDGNGRRVKECTLCHDQVYEQITYTVAFDGDGATANVPASFTKTFGTDVTLSDRIPLKAGYGFIGWSIGDDTYGAGALLNKDYTTADGSTVTLKAVWEKETYTVTFTGAHVSGQPDSALGDTLFTGTVTADDGYHLTEAVTVTIGGRKLDASAFNYEIHQSADGKKTATVTIPKDRMIGNVVIAANAEAHDFTDHYVHLDGDTHTAFCACGASETQDCVLTEVTDKDNLKTAANCVDKAVYYKYCALCDHVSETETFAYGEVDPNNHKQGTEAFVKTDRVEAKCEETGNIEYYTCPDCGQIYSDAAGANLITAEETVIKAKGHNYTGDYVCLEHGTHYRKCVNGCGTCGLGTEKDAAEACTYGEWTNDGNGRRMKECTLCHDQVYEQITYTVAFDGDGATANVPASFTKTYGTDVTLSDRIPVKAGYDFIGWSIGDDTYEAGALLNKDYTVEDGSTVTLTAVWDNALYTVTYTGSHVSGTPVDASGDTEFVGTVSTANAYHLTDEVTVTIAGRKLDASEFTYVVTDEAGRRTATVTIPAAKMIGNVVIAANTEAHDYALNPTHVDGTDTHTLYCECGASKTLSCVLTEVTDQDNLKTAANCVDKAVYYKYCALCDHVSETETFVYGEVDPNNHKQGTEAFVKTDRVEAKCEETGNIEYYTCPDCGRIYSDAAGANLITTEDTVIKAKGHNYTGDEYVVVSEGYHARSCVNGCGTYGVGTEKDAAEACTYGEWTNFGDGRRVRYCIHCEQAQYEAITYPVAFDGNGATANVPASFTKTYGVDVTLSDTEPTRIGYVFTGWAIGDDTYDAGDSFTGDYTVTDGDTVTLKAVWEKETYTVTFTGAHVSGQPDSALGDTLFTGTVTADDGYHLTEAVTVTIGGRKLDASAFTYEIHQSADGKKTATVTISADRMIGNVVIAANAEAHDFTDHYVHLDGDTHTAFCACGAGETQDCALVETLEYPVSAANCVDKAVYNKSCSLCGNRSEQTFTYGDVDPDTHKSPFTAFEKHDRVEPDCLTEGNIEYYVCPDCGRIYKSETEPLGEDETVVLAALGHNLTKTEAVAATCTADGTEAYWTCTRCDKLFSDEAGTNEIDAPVVIDALGHDWGVWTVTTEATCTEGGVETRECGRCGLTETRDTQALGHDYIAVITKPATCTEAGVTTYICTRNEEHTYTEEIEAIGHDWSEWIVETSETCLEGGKAYRYCKNDPTHVETKDVPAAGHQLTYVEGVGQTCEQPGRLGYWKCGVCGKLFLNAAGENEVTEADLILPAVGHDYSDPTPISETQHARICRKELGVVCANPETHMIDIADHRWDEGVQVGVSTCAGATMIRYTCVDCGYTRTETGAAGNHTWGAWIYDASTKTHTRSCVLCGATDATAVCEFTATVNRYPNGTEDGETLYTCDVCGGTYTEALPATGVTVSFDAVSLTEGDAKALKAYTVPGHTEIPASQITWTVPTGSDVVTVEDGVITAVKAGSAVVRAQIGDFSAICTVNVAPKPVTRYISISTQGISATNVKGTSFMLKATVMPDNVPATDIKWTSSNEAVATVDETGMITYTGVGTAIISAVGSDGNAKGSLRVVTTADPAQVHHEVTTYTVIYVCNDVNYVVNGKVVKNDLYVLYPAGSNVTFRTQKACTVLLDGVQMPAAADGSYTIANIDRDHSVLTSTNPNAGLPDDGGNNGGNNGGNTGDNGGSTVVDGGGQNNGGSGACKYCGKYHTGFFGIFIRFFHMIAYFFAHLFGRM